MKKRLWLALPVALFAGAAIAAVVDATLVGPTTEQLVADIAELDQQVEAAKGTAAKYGEGSALHALTELQISILQTTRALLDQKRRSWLRGVTLTYTVEGRSVPPSTTDDVNAIAQDIQKSTTELEAAEAKVATYSGGLIQSLALVEPQTHRVTIAMLRQKLVMQKSGLVLPSIELHGAKSSVGRKSSPVPPLGREISDKGAL